MRKYTINIISLAAAKDGARSGLGGMDAKIASVYEIHVMDLLTFHIMYQGSYNGNNNYSPCSFGNVANILPIYTIHVHIDAIHRDTLFLSTDSVNVYKRNCLINKSISIVAFFEVFLCMCCLPVISLFHGPINTVNDTHCRFCKHSRNVSSRMRSRKTITELFHRLCHFVLGLCPVIVDGVYLFLLCMYRFSKSVMTL